MTNEQIEAFLSDLTKLSLKHGIYVWGCGCCGSPGLSDVSGMGHYEHGPQVSSYRGFAWVEDDEPPELADEPVEDWSIAEVLWHEGVDGE